MTTTQPAPDRPFAVARELVEAVAGRNFDGVAATLEPDATLLALLPRGVAEWHGADEIRGAFATWFGNVDKFDVADAGVGRVGDLMQIRWRFHVHGEPRFPEPVVVEQCLYVSTNEDARIDRIRLLCSGFHTEH